MYLNKSYVSYSQNIASCISRAMTLIMTVLLLVSQ